jgi:xanthomonalisin
MMMRMTTRRASLVAAASLLAGLLSVAQARAGEHPLLSLQLPQIVATHQATRAATPDAQRRMSLSVSLPQRNQDKLYNLLNDIYDPASPNYHHYLSVAEFTERFGPSATDYEAARAYFAANGFTVAGAAANRGLITIEGNVATIERVFHVVLGLYRHPTENRLFISPDREPSLDLAVPILHVTGLDDFDLPRPRSLRRDDGRVSHTGSGPHGNFIGSDIRTAYAGDTKLTGAGQSLGLMELGGYALSDIQAYFNAVNQPLNVPIDAISTDGAPVGCNTKCRDGEQALDIEYAISMAPGLAQLQVYVGKNAEDVLNRMASDDTSLQLSTSWGWSRREYPTDHPLFLEMAAQGQTFLVASGDNSSLKASDPWPEEDAFITAVGGTDLVTASPGGPWLRETGWEDSAGGPALQRKFPIQGYQLPFVNTANKASRKRRNVPDIAGDANFNNYECYNGKCEGGWGGTSFAAPIWAGFIALANEKAARKNQPPVGFINPLLYALGGRPNYDQLFHDEVRGTSGLYSCSFSFDLVTGLGSPQLALIDALVGKND